MEQVKERPILMSAPMVRATLRDLDPKTQTRRVVKPQPSSGLLADYADIRAKRGSERTDAQMLSDCLPCPYGKPGERLWVRETWKWHGGMLAGGPGRAADGGPLYQDLVVSYPADGARLTFHPNGQDWLTPKQPPQREGEVYSLRDAPADFAYDGENTYYDRLTRWWNRKIPAIHMPRWASRILLEITDVRVERLQDISEADAQAEGICELPLQEGHLNAWWTADAALGATLHGRTPVQAYRKLWEHINGPGSWDANPWVWAISFKNISEQS